MQMKWYVLQCLIVCLAGCETVNALKKEVDDVKRVATKTATTPPRIEPPKVAGIQPVERQPAEDGDLPRKVEQTAMASGPTYMRVRYDGIDRDPAALPARTMTIDPTTLHDTPLVFESQIKLRDMSKLDVEKPEACVGTWESFGPAFIIELTRPASAGFRIGLISEHGSKMPMNVAVAGPGPAFARRTACAAPDPIYSKMPFDKGSLAFVTSNQPWPAGTYRVWVRMQDTAAREHDGEGKITFQPYLMVWDADRSAPWGPSVPTVDLPPALDRAQYFETTLQAGSPLWPPAVGPNGEATRSTIFRSKLNGRSLDSLVRQYYSLCYKAAMPDVPNVRIIVSSPSRGLRIQPLAHKAPLAVSVQYPRGELPFARDPQCVMVKAHERGGPPASLYERDPNKQLPYGTPSWWSPHTISIEDGFVGELLVRVGTFDPTDNSKVQLMVFDATTTFQPMTARPPLFKPGFLDRELTRIFPEMDTRLLNGIVEAAGSDGSTNPLDTVFGAAARVFLAVPDDVFVYPTEDVPIKIKDPLVLSRTDMSILSSDIVRRNEPVLLVTANARIPGFGDTYGIYLTMDGIPFMAHAKQMALVPSGPLALPKAPRPIETAVLTSHPHARTILDFSPETSAIFAKIHALVEKYNKCRDRIVDAYDKRIDEATVEVRGRNGTVTIADQRVKQLEAAVDPAIEAACGKEETKVDKPVDALFQQVMKLVQAHRAKLMKPVLARFGG